jgi:hypothetical protein
LSELPPLPISQLNGWLLAGRFEMDQRHPSHEVGRCHRDAGERWGWRKPEWGPAASGSLVRFTFDPDRVVAGIQAAPVVAAALAAADRLWDRDQAPHPSATVGKLEGEPSRIGQPRMGCPSTRKTIHTW